MLVFHVRLLYLLPPHPTAPPPLRQPHSLFAFCCSFVFHVVVVAVVVAVDKHFENGGHDRLITLYEEAFFCSLSGYNISFTSCFIVCLLSVCLLIMARASETAIDVRLPGA